MLFGPERHEPLAGDAWSELAARAAIERWVTMALADFDPDRGWRAHPREDGGPPGEPLHELYGGAGGAIWALEHLAEVGAVHKRWDFRDFVAGLAEKQVSALADSRHGSASFLLGESGLRLLHWKLTRDDAVAQRLFDVIEGNLHNPVCEQLWGSSGTVLAAIAMAEYTGEARWAGLVQRTVQTLWDEMEPIDAAAGNWGWVQHLYGRVETLIGAGHGFVGNVYPAVRGAAFITPELHDAFAARALDFLQATALRDGDCVNWWPRVPPPSPATKPPLVQDCHGAAGIVCRLAALPRSVPDHAGWDTLLLQAGELTWRAGPLTKGVAFCHGTAGSAHALLHLFARTGDQRWLERARAFAMHGIVQVEQERSRPRHGSPHAVDGRPGHGLCFVGLHQRPTGVPDARLLLTDCYLGIGCGALRHSRCSEDTHHADPSCRLCGSSVLANGESGCGSARSYGNPQMTPAARKVPRPPRPAGASGCTSSPSSFSQRYPFFFSSGAWSSDRGANSFSMSSQPCSFWTLSW